VRLLTQGSAGGELPKTQEPLERHVACAWATRNVASHIWGGSWEAPVAEQQPGPFLKTPAIALPVRPLAGLAQTQNPAGSPDLKRPERAPTRVSLGVR
jgi:hypothetical protein